MVEWTGLSSIIYDRISLDYVKNQINLGSNHFRFGLDRARIVIELDQFGFGS